MFEDNKVLLLGEKIEIENFKDWHIIGIVCSGGGVNGMPAYTYDDLLYMPEDSKLIIVDDHWTFEILYEFNKLMLKLGLCIGEDYIYNSMLKGKINTNRIYRLLDCSKENFNALMKAIMGKKKLVILHGNCQVHVLINMLEENQEFKRKYITCEMPRLWMREDEVARNIMIESGILHLASYLFTQEVSPENAFGYHSSTEYMVSQLSGDCKVVMIPNLYFTGYFPQLKRYDDDRILDWWENDKGRKFSSYNGQVESEVLNLILQGKDDKEILEEISKDDYYSLAELQKNIESELEEFAIREKENDIQICDFLRENYNKFLMFATENHPTRDVLIEVARRILKKLKINDMNIVCSASEIQPPCPNNYNAIYPCVLKAFGFPKMEYNLHIELNGRQLPVLTGIDEKIDRFIEENSCHTKREYSIDATLDFQKYMLVYIRILRAVISI